MGKFSPDAKELLAAIGGKENITAVSHCITRMRFVLTDPKNADIKRIEAIKSVKGTFTQAGQFQVIIGNEVADFYKDFTEVSGVSGVSKSEVKSMSKQNQNILQRLMTSIAEIFAPLIPAIVVGGLILGFRNVIDSMEIFGGATLVSQSQFWAGVDHFLWLLGEAVFHVGIPVGICWTIMKKMGGTEMLGIILGLTLVSSQLTNAYAVASAMANGTLNQWNFGFIQVNMIGYQAQVLPAMLAAFTLAYLERFFKKIVPQVVQMILVPFFSLLFAVMAAHFVLGPIGWRIGSWISAAVYAGISGSYRVIFGAIFGFFYAPLVITGLHHMSNAIDIQLIADFGGTMLWPMIALSNIAQGSAVLGMIFLQRRSAKAKELNIPSCISCYLGVTEPAMFGVNLKYVFPFICGMAGSCIAGIISTATSVTASAIGVGGLPGILSIQPGSIAMFAVCMAVAVAVPFALTYMAGKRKGIDKEAEDEALKEEAAERAKAEHSPVDFMAFLTGKTVAITEVPDATFAEKVLGDGIAIEPVDNILVSPVDAVVEQTMEGSNHAIGLIMDNGLEILLHIGLDTVAMNGEGFTIHVSEGDRVKKGQELITFDPEKIRAAGHPVTTIMVVTNDSGYETFRFDAGLEVKAAENVIAHAE
ncbi:MAG: PTS system trehalose-specific EIIBC component [Synergistaceae bacterium]|nr:PTS system trehalose-specific EIIBC component [Synergistaceae bacterium]MBQ4401737.1 PTS system trehalose-specific EIIBC component [Synergistaceae bacterium]MBQ6113950.1 PTS system trehalose-specific EIIBC component [Synergistaceae bacterium]MBQ6417708.1 PTS system trehalose-specific EIIBC component [Synergistaceae bacterium]MBQ6665386.1 PTS system trehalose-specific EIIBC component [Synergistaceae bacterium]